MFSEQQIVEALSPPPRFLIGRPRCRDVLKAVEKESGISAALIRSELRHGWIVKPRHVAMLLAREVTQAVLTVIGREFRRDHTTVMSGIVRARYWIDEDPTMARLYAAVMAEMRR